MNLKSCQLFKCELNIVVRHEGFFFNFCFLMIKMLTMMDE